MRSCREFKSAIREIAALIRESALVRPFGPPNPILREISKVAEKGKEGRRQIARVAEGPGTRNSLAERAPPRSPSGASRRGGVGPLRGAESRLRELR